MGGGGGGGGLESECGFPAPASTSPSCVAKRGLGWISSRIERLMGRLAEKQKPPKGLAGRCRLRGDLHGDVECRFRGISNEM